MSEIKDDVDFGKAMEAYRKMRGYSDIGKVRAALEAYAPKIERAIAEAVAAERERCAKVCEELAARVSAREGAGDPEMIIAASASLCAETIRSTAP